MIWIIGLIVIGLVLITFEIVVPGGVLGVLGVGAMVIACVLAFQSYGAMGAFIVFFIALIVTIVMLILEFKLLPKTKIGQAMFLNKAVEAQSTQELGDKGLEGKEGEALTTLAPTGMVQVEGKSYESFSRDGLIPKGGQIRVVGRDNFRIIVEKL